MRGVFELDTPRELPGIEPAMKIGLTSGNG